MHVVVKASRERVKGDAVKHNLSSKLSSLFLIFLSAERVWNITPGETERQESETCSLTQIQISTRRSAHQIMHRAADIESDALLFISLDILTFCLYLFKH